MAAVTARCRHCLTELDLEIVVVVDMDATNQHLGRIERAITQQGEQIMTAQDNINADVTALTALLTDLPTAVAAIKAELDAKNVTVDTSALDALVAQLPGAQASVDALVTPAVPATPVDTGSDDGSQPTPIDA